MEVWGDRLKLLSPCLRPPIAHANHFTGKLGEKCTVSATKKLTHCLDVRVKTNKSSNKTGPSRHGPDECERHRCVCVGSGELHK